MGRHGGFSALALLCALSAPAGLLAQSAASLWPTDQAVALALTGGDAGLVATGAPGTTTSALAAVGAQFAPAAAQAAGRFASGASFTRAASQAPALPTDYAARTLSAWVNCEASTAPGSAGRTILDLFDGSSSALTEHFALLGSNAATATAAINKPEYNVTTFLGSSCGTAVDGPAATAVIGTAFDLRFANDGTLYFLDRGGSKIKVLSTAGVVSTLAGSGSNGNVDGQGTSASFYNPYGLALDPTQTLLYVGNTKSNTIRRIHIASGNVTTIGGINGQATNIDGPLGIATLNGPGYMAIDFAGNIYTEAVNIRMLNISAGVAKAPAASSPAPAAKGVVTSSSGIKVRV
jgi:hypothetical protein